MNKNDLSNYNPTSEFLLYKTPNGAIKVDVLLQNETIWMPQKKIAELFDVNVPAISKHLYSACQKTPISSLCSFRNPVIYNSKLLNL
jgi:hypothetical protein